MKEAINGSGPKLVIQVTSDSVISPQNAALHAPAHMTETRPVWGWTKFKFLHDFKTKFLNFENNLTILALILQTILNSERQNLYLNFKFFVSFNFKVRHLSTSSLRTETRAQKRIIMFALYSTARLKTI